MRPATGPAPCPIAVASGRYGVRVDEDVDAARAAFEAAVADACAADPWLRDHPVDGELARRLFAPGPLPRVTRLLERSRRCPSVGATRPTRVGAPYGSDLRHYAAAGIPTLQYGPGDVGFAHAADEHVPVADLVTCARVYALLAVRACSTSPS